MAIKETKLIKSKLIIRIANNMEILEELIENPSRYKPVIMLDKNKINKSEAPTNINYLNFKLKIEAEIRDTCIKIEKKLGLGIDKIDKLKWRKFMKEKGIITKEELISAVEKYQIKLTDRLLNWYKEIGLIEPSIMKTRKELGLEGQGTVGLYKEDTPKIIYVVQVLKESGMKIKLEEFKYWFDLLKLDDFAINEIKEILRAYRQYEKELFNTLHITIKQREDLLRNYPLKVLNYDLFITDLDILKRFLIERSYAEFNQAEISDIYIKNLNPDNTIKVSEWTDNREFILDATDNPVDNALAYPEIEININDSKITVSYKEPVNKTVIFKKGGVVEVL